MPHVLSMLCKAATCAMPPWCQRAQRTGFGGLFLGEQYSRARCVPQALLYASPGEPFSSIMGCLRAPELPVYVRMGGRAPTPTPHPSARWMSVPQIAQLPPDFVCTCRCVPGASTETQVAHSLGASAPPCGLNTQQWLQLELSGYVLGKV